MYKKILMDRTIELQKTYEQYVNNNLLASKTFHTLIMSLLADIIINAVKKTLLVKNRK